MENKEILENVKQKIAISNFMEEEKVMKLNKPLKTVASFVLALGLTASVVYAGINFDNIKEYFRGLGNGIDTAAEHGYIENPKMDYIKSETYIIKNDSKIIDNVNVDVKIDNFIMDDRNLSTEFEFKFSDNIVEYVDLDNIYNILLKDLVVIDEENNRIFDGGAGLNWFPTSHSKENNMVKLMYNMFGEEVTKS